MDRGTDGQTDDEAYAPFSVTILGLCKLAQVVVVKVFKKPWRLMSSLTPLTRMGRDSVSDSDIRHDP